ncbi:TVP38/TMEM64 family protein [Adhaeribacter radiodurans]|uniref:TVP38/TMEM64 family membrane protein n=1 Tax=Adhaeribacter radiodurans TaxID=2745197 RepID=A0A7L7LAB6_9BACT|nr:VTT domain-containing protein [Adhaeribacter radiodurans]QMU29781.1 VTT domain-containing protein [Adhaeribacter radiodurans]
MIKQLFQKNLGTLVVMALLAVGPVLISSTVAVLLYQYQAVLQQLTFGQMVLYFMVVSFTMAFALTPTTFVALVTGFYLGWNGFPGVVISYGVASLIGYGLAQIIDHGKLIRFISHFDKAAAVMEELKHQSWSLIILTRISPVLPFALMTFVLAMMKVEKKKFFLASIVGMLPRTLFFFWLGTQAQDIIALLQNPDTGKGGQILIITLVLVSLFGLYVLFNRALKKALSKRVDAKI